MEYPDQSVSDKDKNKDGKKWYKMHIDYAEDLINSTSAHFRRIDRLYTEFNGKYSHKKSNEVIQRYKKGDRNISKSKFIDYKLTTGKIERLVGEFLKKPLKPIVMTTNKDAVSKKMDEMSINMAMSEAKPEIEKLRNQMGLNIMENRPIVDKNDPDYMEKINPKTENEKYMTAVLQEQIRRLDLKPLCAMALRDLAIASECHGFAEIDNNKKIKGKRIHPKDAIYQEIEADEFIKRSAIVGYREELTMSEIMQRYRPNKKQVEMLKALEGQEERWSDNHIKYVEKRENRLIIWSTHVMWFGCKEVYEKYVPGKNNELIDFYQKILSPEYYEKNKKKIEKDVAAGKYKVRKSYKMTIYEARRIGPDWWLNMREQPFIIQADGDTYGLFYNYTGLLLNSVDGIRMSLQEKLQDLNDLYNIVMWQIRREIGKYKGSALILDEAFLKKNQSMNDVLYMLDEEGVVTYNSNAEENRSNRFMEQTAGINTHQVGDNQSLLNLVALKNDILMMVDRISGINEAREGEGAATQTATGTMEALNASRTITTPLFYYHTKWMENFFTRILEQTKYAVGYLGDDSFDEIIGDDGVSFFKKTKDVHLDTYGVYLADPNRESELRSKMTQYGMAAVNAGEIKIQDMMRAEMAPTLHEADTFLQKGFDKVNEIAERQNRENLESQERNVQAQHQAMQEDREDKQAHDKEMEILKANLKGAEQTLQAKNDAELQDNATQNPL